MASLPVNKTLNKKEMDTIKQSVAILAVLAACPARVQAQDTAVARLIAVNEAFDAALSRKDIEAVDAAWLHGPDATAIHPSSKTPIIGWDAVRKSWEKTLTPSASCPSHCTNRACTFWATRPG